MVNGRELGVDEQAVIKTLVIKGEGRRALLVLKHGDREVLTRQLARHIGVRTVAPFSPTVASRHSAYLIGGSSPFGARKVMPV
ncbi:MAG TPA: YbaK/EbsC family protein [Accumulibacter sp.]|uniref:YbaK/EbsC family protein n=1 Tax=Accumulibacter sp. TaxID=2053492 RepID=UPI002B573FE3|nr:YbaK/EbsC family protein [Accumulibacter sp.]HRF72366.1 YbaK/EbsC family protein [Accumulibacter sp.]